MYQVCMYVCMYVCACVYVCVCMYPSHHKWHMYWWHTQVHVFKFTGTWLRVNTRVCTSVSIHIDTYMHAYILVYKCFDTHTYIDTYTHTYVCIQVLRYTYIRFYPIEQRKKNKSCIYISVKRYSSYDYSCRKMWLLMRLFVSENVATHAPNRVVKRGHTFV